MKHYTAEIFITIFLIIVAGLLWNPYWMPMGVVFVALVSFVVLFGGFAIFVWRERGGDEREIFINQVASRVAYLITAGIMAIGVVYQTLVYHEVDPWLAVAFVATILAKAFGHGYAKMKY